MDCKKMVNCSKCGDEAILVGTSQTADGKIFCEYQCGKCENQFMIDRKENSHDEIRRMKRKLASIDNRINRNEISAIEAVRLLGLIVYQIVEWLSKMEDRR